MSEQDTGRKGLRDIANAIYPADSTGGPDAGGTHVTSLTEAVMGISRGLWRLGDAILDVAMAIREGRSK